MAKSSLFLVASLLLLLLPQLSLASAARDPTKASTNLETAFENETCGYEPIENLTNYFQLLGSFAVAQFNNQNDRNVVFQRTMSAAQFIHFGTSYDLLIRAIDGIRPGTFRAIVYKAGHEQNVRYILNDFVAISRTQNPSQEA